MPSVTVMGAGAVGSRCVRHLLSQDAEFTLEVIDKAPERARTLVRSVGDRACVAVEPRVDATSVLVTCVADRDHLDIARRALSTGATVISTADGLDSVSSLLGLDDHARAHGGRLIAGAAFSPGMSCLLAVLGRRWFDRVTEVHVARSGTGGPACARHHHRALGRAGFDWRDGSWERRPAGSGRELIWFPDPIGGADCYLAALAEPVSLRVIFSDAERVTARLAANRRNRLTARFPMLAPPHPEGGVGGIRVELRGWVGTRRQVVALGAVGRPAVVAGVVAAHVALCALDGAVGPPGARGLGALPRPLPLLEDLRIHGVPAVVFEGA